MWAATDTLRVGDLYVGVRSHPGSLSARIRKALADRVIDGVDAPANFSVRQERGGPGAKRPARAYALYRSRCLVLRTRTRERALRALGRYLSGLTATPDGLVRVRQLAVVGGSGAIVLPPELHWRLEALEPRLRASGLWLADPPLLEIDPQRREVVVAPPVILVGADGASDRSPPIGRYTIREWAILGDDGEPAPAQVALAAVMPLVERDMSPPAAMEEMLRTLCETRLTRIRHASATHLLERLVG